MADNTEPTWRSKHKIGAIMSRLDRHSGGELDMTATQVAAARLYLDKTLPSLSAVDSKHYGDPTKPIVHKLEIELIRPNASKDS